MLRLATLLRASEKTHRRQHSARERRKKPAQHINVDEHRRYDTRCDRSIESKRARARFGTHQLDRHLLIRLDVRPYIPPKHTFTSVKRARTHTHTHNTYHPLARSPLSRTNERARTRPSSPIPHLGKCPQTTRSPPFARACTYSPREAPTQCSKRS